MDQLNELEILIRMRLRFENEVYDYLVDPFAGVPEEFWDPVQVSLPIEKLNELTVLSHNDVCCICCTPGSKFTYLDCCKNEMCQSCSNQWFCISVYCPYCKNDLRND
jgi:hypothetical protein